MTINVLPLFPSLLFVDWLTIIDGDGQNQYHNSVTLPFELDAFAKPQPTDPFSNYF